MTLTPTGRKRVGTGIEGVSGGSLKGRLEPLDALRGVAAFAVSLGHLTILLSGAGAVIFAIGDKTPLAAFWRGNSAVLFFFMLSGFVLAIPFFKRPVSPTSFIVKRILRIYPAYWAACLLAFWVALQGTLLAADTPRLDWRLGTNYLFLFGAFNVNIADPVIWSLVHEIRVSVLFPFLMLAVKRFPSKWLLLGAAPIAFAGLLVVQPDGLTSTASLAGTVWYSYLFLLGACLARHRLWLAEWVARLPRAVIVIGLLGCLAMYGMPVMSDAYPVWRTALNFSLIAGGASGIMLIALARPLTGAVLRARPLLFMGRISYGYYLIHVPLLLLFIHYGSARVPNVVIAAAVIATTIGIAWLLNIWVEKPAIELGRRLADKLDRRLLPQPPMGQKASVVQTQASASDRSNP